MHGAFYALGRIAMIRVALACAALWSVLPMSRAASQVGFTGGTEYGFGAYGRLDRALGVEAGVGFAPLLVLNLTVSEDSKLYFPLAVGAKLTIPVSKPGSPTPIGVKFGVTHNDILKTGFGGGLTARVRDRLVIGGGLMYYPQAQDGLTDKINEDSGSSYTEVVGATFAIQPFISVSVLLGARARPPGK